MLILGGGSPARRGRGSFVTGSSGIADISGANIGRHDFNSASIVGNTITGAGLGTLTTAWPSDVSIVADPLGTGRGNVARVNYAENLVGQGTVDRSFGFATGTSYGLGSTIHNFAEILVPAGSASDAGQQRKLMYLKGGWDPVQENDRYRIVPLLRGNNLYVSAKREHQSGATTVFHDEQAVLATFPFGQWNWLELRTILNSTQAANDGAFTCWMNGVEVLTVTGLNWTDASWGAADDEWEWYEWSIGDQAQDDLSSSGRPQEYRYFNNVAASTARIAV